MGLETLCERLSSIRCSSIVHFCLHGFLSVFQACRARFGCFGFGLATMSARWAEMLVYSLIRNSGPKRLTQFQSRWAGNSTGVIGVLRSPSVEWLRQEDPRDRSELD